MPKYQVSPEDRAAIAASIVPPKDPYKGYNQRQAELSEKDHPWAQPIRVEEPVAEIAVDEATLARAAFHSYAYQEFRLTGPDNRTDAEKAEQAEINAVGRAAVDAELAKIRERRGES